MDNISMKVKDRTQVKDSAGDASSVFAGQAVGSVGIASAVIGVWAACCMVSAVVAAGPIALVKGWFASVM